MIELLVVIAIIAILAAILLPVLNVARDKARQAVCMNNLRQLGMAFEMYLNDFDERYPHSRAPSTQPWPYRVFWYQAIAVYTGIERAPVTNEAWVPPYNSVFYCPTYVPYVKRGWPGTNERPTWTARYYLGYGMPTYDWCIGGGTDTMNPWKQSYALRPSDTMLVGEQWYGSAISSVCCTVPDNTNFKFHGAGDKKGMNILFIDKHVEFFPDGEGLKNIWNNNTTRRTQRPFCTNMRKWSN